MHRRYEHANIPIEVIRTFVCIVGSGSFSKAGNVLGLSQPAISAQMKRLQVMIGGAIFDRGQSGTSLTARGALALTHAKRILQENDQILSLGGATSDSQPVRVGLPTIYADAFLKILAPTGWQEQLTFQCAHSLEIGKSFTAGYLDVACVTQRQELFEESAHTWREPRVWARHRNFVLSPGSPIPVVSWPGSIDEQPAVKALERNGSAYRVVFTSYDYSARIAAVGAGLGLMSMAERHVRAPLVVAKEYYLPQLHPIGVGINVRGGLPASRTEKVVQLLALLRPGMLPEWRQINETASDAVSTSDVSTRSN